MEQKTIKIPFYVKRQFGEKINVCFDFLKENAKVVFKYLLLVSLPLAIIQAFFANLLFSSLMDIQMGSYDNVDGFVMPYILLIFFSMIGSWLILSLTYALVYIYNNREDGLKGITFKDIRPRFSANLKRCLILFILISVLLGFIGVFIGLLVWLTPFTLIITLPALFYFLFALSMATPTYLFEDIDVSKALTKGFRLGSATWGGMFGVMLIMGMIGSAIQGALSIPWYIGIGVKSVLFLDGGMTISPAATLYNVMLYLLAVLQTLAAYLVMVLPVLGMSYHYAHAAEKVDHITVGQEIDNFENL